MVALNIKENQGLTQALRDYALGNGLIAEDEVKNINWNNTIFKLEEIQKTRTQNNDKSIFTGGTEKNDWHKNFVVTKGSIELSEDELKSLMDTMRAKPKEEVKADSKTTPKEEAKAEPKAAPKEEAKVDPKTDPKADKTNGKIESDKINGTYEIAANNEGNGYTLKNEFKLNGEQAVEKFYKSDDIKQNTKNGKYSIRGLSSQNYNILQSMIRSDVNDLTINHAIYMDLKKKDEKQLTKAEKMFMKDFTDKLTKKGFALDPKSNEIIDAAKNTTESTKRKKFLGIF